MSNLCACVDIGGTKIAYGLIDDASPTTVTAVGRTPTPTHDVMSAVLGVIRELVESARQQGRTIDAIGVGAPGVIDPVAGRVVSAGPTMPGWAGTNIADAIRNEFDVPLAVHNDVRIMGLGESVFGAAQGVANTLFVSLGTGVGGALVRGARLVDSPHHTAGELRALLGRLPDGHAAPVEDFAAGPGLARSYNELTGSNIQLPEIMQRYHAGEATAHTVISGNMAALGEALAGFASAIDIDALIIGGGVGAIGDPILEPLIQGFRQHALHPIDTIPILPAQLGTNAPLVGAGYLASLACKGE
ncbi:N-acetyl-D-glucosamine kinase [Corynebacterium kalinowskii]|uniref:N-acetyl-D-glucosamine kinase n=1 Tax=Corynebacterium kalinowskii TaxID=2675216 RepID=A0A6B8VPD8_9CORY|nr:ROK family protein [Corynebacterium kalinowskii]QGU01417.1 N-acetyl-D-glucosamine kinase [Corynebacterium kalinowskii]